MLELHLEPADLPALLREPVHALQPLIGRRPVVLELVLDEGLAPRVLVDSMRLRQVVLNLLSNAVKFTAEGRVELAARVLAEDTTGQTIELVVADTGCGVPADRIEHVFERYAQADAGTASRYGGTGLGLALSKRIVEAMGGTIAMTSAQGAGTRVRVVVHLARAAAAPAPPDAARTAGLRVLLAEDDLVQQMVLVAALERRGCVVDVAGNGLEALALWRRHRHRVVLSDCRMPAHDGHGFARALRGEPGGEAVRLVGMSTDVDDVQAALAAGMEALVQKPVAERVLDDLLADLGEAVPTADGRPALSAE